MLDTFCRNLIVESIRVYPPKRYVLLCGGEVGSVVELTPKSLRDAFLKGNGFARIKSCDTLRIEEIEEFFDKNSPYTDLVAFERDIALVCDLIILFCESPGSFTELGCFSMVDEIYDKILVIVQNQYLDRSNFISKGPVSNFRRVHAKSVYAIVDSGIDIIDENISTVNCLKLVENVIDPILERLKQTEDRTSLDTNKFNHLCKVYVALLREFYCLNDDEILLLLWEIGFDLDMETLNRVSFCCLALKWSGVTSVRFDRMHYAIQKNNEAAKFEFSAPLSDKMRRRSEIRQYWEALDPDRVSAVSQAMS